MIALLAASDSPRQIVADGALPLAMFFAALAGLVSFASPCVLPLVPGFLAYVTGLTDETVGAHDTLLLRVGGVFVIVMGLLFLGVLGQRGFTVRWRPAAGLLGAPLLGAVFALGMSPCVGPVYGAILAANTALGSSGVNGRGLLLTACYSLGIGIPFILIAAGWSRAERASKWLRARHRPIQLVGGGLMIAIGVLMVTGLWNSLIADIQTHLVNQFEPVI